jgi:hypothetical protein
MCSGDNGLAEYNMRNQQPMKKGRQIRSGTETEDDEQAILFRDLPERIQTGFRIYFPTKETVACSKGGVDVSCLKYSHAYLTVLSSLEGWWNNLFPVKVVPCNQIPSRANA